MRAVALTVICIFSIKAQLKDKFNGKNGEPIIPPSSDPSIANSTEIDVKSGVTKNALLVSLFLFPDFLFISAYVLLFFTWLETFIFAHQQYFFNLERFQKFSRIFFVLFNFLLILLDAIFVIEFCVPSQDSRQNSLRMIYNLLVFGNACLPVIFILVGMFFKFIYFSGFEYASALSGTRIVRLTQVFLVWSFCRVCRGLLVWFYNRDLPKVNVWDINLLSIILFTSILLAEVVPFNMLMDWATISLLLLGEETDLIDKRDREFVELGLESPLPQSQWRIDPADLQVSAAGLLPQRRTDFSSTVKGNWNGRPVTITLFHMADISISVLEELAVEVAEVNNLDHEHLATFLGTSVVPGSIYIVQENTLRGSLFEFIQKSTIPFTRDFIVKVAQEICSVMMYLHEQQHPPITHGSLSSKTVMLTENLNVKLINLGLQRLRSYVQVMLVTRVDSAWTSPEQMTGKSPTPASDVYAFGIILWELCTLKEPFQNISSPLLRKTVGRRRLRPSLKNVNSELAEIMTQCWAHNPEDRPTFPELARMLDDSSK